MIQNSWQCETQIFENFSIICQMPSAFIFKMNIKELLGIDGMMGNWMVQVGRLATNFPTF